MTERMKKWLRELPTFILSFLLAVAVWISAVTAADPNETRQYPLPVIVEVLGLEPGLSLIGDIPETALLTMTAPKSTWNTLNNSPEQVKAFLDLSGKARGDYDVKIKTQLGIRPVEVVSVDPAMVSIHLEDSASISLPVSIDTQGEPATGYNIGEPTFSERIANVTGPESMVSQIDRVIATINVDEAKQTITQAVELKAIDGEGDLINNLSIAPAQVTVTLPVEPEGGYRNVAVKAVVAGQLEPGYRLTNISVLPPTVTVYSEDSKLVSQLPGYIETSVVSVAAAKSDFDIGVSLKLPGRVSVIGDQTVTVHIGITPIENSVTIQNIKVEVIGLPEGMKAVISPEYLSVIVSGPLNLLNQLNSSQVNVSVDLTGKQHGTYQLIPQAEINITELRIESILPGTIEVILSAQ